MSRQLAAADSQPRRTPFTPKETRASHIEKQHLKKGQDRSKSRRRRCVHCAYCTPWKLAGNGAAGMSSGVHWAHVSVDDRRYISGAPSVVKAMNDGVAALVRSKEDANIEASDEAYAYHVWETSDDYRMYGATGGPSERVVTLEALLENAKPSKKPSSKSARVDFEVLPALQRVISLDSSAGVFDDTMSGSFSFADLEHGDVYESDSWEIVSDTGAAPVGIECPSYASVVSGSTLE